MSLTSSFGEHRPAPRRHALPILVIWVALAIFLVTRIGLALYTGAVDVPPAEWPRVLAMGLAFDLATLAFLIAPVLLYEALLPSRWRTSRWHGALRFGWLALSVFALLFGAVSEATFWLEFSTRLNFIAVDYLLYTQEVIGNIRQSYPIGRILGGLAVLALAVSAALWPLVRAGDRRPLSGRRRAGYLLAALALPLLSWAVWDSDRMRGSGNEFADELSGNGLFTFGAALRRNELDYDRFYRTMPQAGADRVLAALGVRRPALAPVVGETGEAAGAGAAGASATSGAPAPTAPGPATNPTVSTAPAPNAAAPTPRASPLSRAPRNVVLVSIESLSADFVGAWGGQGGLTPRLDQLAREGLMFSRFFATGTRTVRGLEALSLGTPPVPGQAIVRRPENDDLATVGGLLTRQGWRSYFFYGGYGYFDNMNDYFKANAYQVVDRTDIPKDKVVFENAWGVADEVLFDQALTTLDRAHAEGRPFFAQVMTTSNHRPYTYPDGRIDIPSPGGRNGAVKYTDWAIGKFADDARKHPWFADTLFVFVADHCASVAGRSKLPVRNYHIPLLLWAPGLLKPGVDDRVVSQIDLPPTLLSMLGAQGGDQFFGQVLYGDAPVTERMFVSNYQELGYYRDGLLTILMPKKQVQAFRIDPATWEASPAEPDPARTDEAVAYYQTASRAFRSGQLKARPPATATR